MSTNTFRIGHHYRVRASFASEEYKFVVDEIVLFEGEGFIPYDGLRSYRFRSPSGKEKFWLLRADAPLESWKNYFEPVQS